MGKSGGASSPQKRHGKREERESKRSSEPLDQHEDSDDSNSSVERRVSKLLSKKRGEAKERERQRKLLMKSLETPQEKRARRLEKKRQKELKLSQQLGLPSDIIAYQNTTNPYGDPNLTRPFIWRRKLEKDGRERVPAQELLRESRKVVERNMVQLEQIKRSRMQREMIREDIEMMQRDRDLRQVNDWREQEDNFHLQQARERSKIRIKDERPKPIDYLAAYVYCYIGSENWMPDNFLFSPPQDYCANLNLRDCQDLLADIQVYEQLQQGEFTDFWTDIATLVEDKRRLLAAAQGLDVDYRQAVSSAVIDDIEKIFAGKSVLQLIELSKQIDHKIESIEDGLDVSYWEALRNVLMVRIANVRLRELHQNITENKKALDESTAIKEEAEDDYPGPSHGFSVKVAVEKATSACDRKLRLEREMINAYRNGGYSPKYKCKDQLPSRAVIATSDEPVSSAAVANVKYSSAQLAAFNKFESVAKMGMGKDEATFAVEQSVVDPSLMIDRFRTRKPRYFNRVHTGFEWNKYNQTHYDLDNPPPKIVQGYKFNIFYPDLLEEGTPKFTVTPCKHDTDFSIIQFTAGAPYEDIAFKIVNREWEISQKRGYRCVFQNGIFQLWFQFKKYRYRR